MNEMTTVTTAKDWASDQEVRWCPRLRRLCGAEGRAADDAGPRRRAREDGVRQRHRLLEPLSVLHGELRLPHDPRPRAGLRDRYQARQSGARRVDHHRRRRRAVDRRQPPRCTLRATSTADPAVQQRDLRPDQGPIFADQPRGHALPSTPFGSVDRPVTPCAFALGSGARFVARGIDVHKNLPDVLKAAHAHKGASFVEIYQNCVVYNDDVFASFTARDFAADKQLWLKAGEKMLFAGGTKGIALDVERLTLKVVEGDDPSVLVHDPKNRGVAAMLIELPHEGFPVALGVIYEDPRATFESAVIEQNEAAASGKTPDLQKLVAKGQTWQVEKEPHKL